MLPGVFEPSGEVIESVAPGDIVDEEGPSSAAVVRASDGTESFLTSLKTKVQIEFKGDLASPRRF